MEGNGFTTWSVSIEPGRWASAPPGARESRQARQVARPIAPPRRPDGDERARPPESERFAVRIIDNPVSTYEEVTIVCAQVLGISLEEGFRIAETVDHEGSCVVGTWPRAEAERIAAGIAVIGIEVRLEPEGG